MSRSSNSQSADWDSSASDQTRSRVVHVVDNLEPGGAQHILIALARDNPSALVCALYRRRGGSDLFKEFREVDAIASSRYSLVSILAGLVGRIRRYRKDRIFNAHLDASTLFLCLLRKLMFFRLVVTVHATQAQWPAWFRAAFRRIIFTADHVIPESRRALEEILAMGVPAERVTLIPIGTLLSGIGSSGPTVDIRSELGIAPNTPILLNVARMVPGKGQIELVRAMANVTGAVAVIVGYGPEEQRLREEATKLGLTDRVRFAGLRTDLANFYSAARAFVMPCLDESMGVVIYDALTCRLPVIAYASGSIGEILVDGENGYLIQPNVDALARAINQVIHGKTVFRFADPASFSAQTMVARHEMLYRALSRKWFGDQERERP